MVTIALPVGVLYGLSTLRIVPLEVVRVDEQGREVKEAIFSAGGVSGLADLLTGQREKKKQQAVASGRARSPLAGAKGGPVGAGSDPARRPEQGKLAGIDINSVSADQMRGLYEDSAKQDRGPVLRKGLEERPKDTSGGLSDEAVVKVVGQSSSAFQQCIEAELRKNPGFKGGKISIISTVGSSGVVKSAQIDRRDIDLSDLGNCLKGRARAMRFPSFDGDEDAEVHIPLILGASL